MAEMPNKAACASLHGLRLGNDLPMGATVADPAEWEKVLDHYRGAARDMRDGAREYVEADPYHAEWHQLDDDEDEPIGGLGACLWRMAAVAITIGALAGWALS